MIGVDMYHKIKALRSSHSVRATAKSVKHSPATVQKYSKMSLGQADKALSKPRRDRKSQFDSVSSFIDGLLTLNLRMPADVVHRKIKEQYPDLTGKVRALRNYLKPLREKYKSVSIRYFHPVKTSEADSQVQVDLGEIRLDYSDFTFDVKIYFVVFVFSYSRMMFISYQDRPYKSEDFIKAHLEAFRYFGGVAKEYVYDQTKLVVINEKYREVLFNEKFHKFALSHHFHPIVCEGYDPQSKGKVERAIGYIKSSFLECEEFHDLSDLRSKGLDWLNGVANCRIHGTTGRRPNELFEAEKKYLNKEIYLQYSNTEVCVDKTGLINYKGNKYSVPYIYQGKQVMINTHEGKLYCHDIATGHQIAEHTICYDKYESIIDSKHYISPAEKMLKAEQKVMSAFADITTDRSYASELIERFKKDNHNYARYQLLGLTSLVYKYPQLCWYDVKEAIFNLPKVKVSLVARLLEISFNNINFEEVFDVVEYDSPSTSSLDRSLEVYMKRIKPGGTNA
jgi:transposase